MWLAVTALHPPRGSTPVALTGSNAPCVHFINPLEVDGFAEPGGWGTTSAAEKPILYFFPGMDGSLQTPFMQFCELSTLRIGALSLERPSSNVSMSYTSSADNAETKMPKIFMSS